MRTGELFDSKIVGVIELRGNHQLQFSLQSCGVNRRMPPRCAMSLALEGTPARPDHCRRPRTQQRLDAAAAGPVDGTAAGSTE